MLKPPFDPDNFGRVGGRKKTQGELIPDFSDFQSRDVPEIWKKSMKRWDLYRRREIVYQMYSNAWTIEEIARVLGVATSTVSRDLQGALHGIKREMLYTEGFLQRLQEHTVDCVLEAENLQDITMEEIEFARDNNLRKGGHLVGLLQNANKNIELKARLFKLLDPKVELTMGMQKAVQMQEILLRALIEVAPEIAETVLQRAEELANGGVIKDGEEVNET